MTDVKEYVPTADKNTTTYEPMPGYALVEPMGAYDLVDGLILELPESVKGRHRDVCKILDVKAGLLRKCCDCGHVQQIGVQCRGCQSEKLRVKSVLSDVSELEVGKYGLHATGALVSLDVGIAIIPIEDILALSDDADDFGVPDRKGMDRCIQCGPAVSGSPNGMLLIDGVCPRCGWKD